MRKFASFIIALAVSLLATGAFAHAMLDHASPAVGASVSGSPGAVRLWFTEALEPRFSGAEVTGPVGRVGGRASVSGNQLTISLPHLAPGAYRVNWHVISVDTHKTEGSFSFEVRP
ncbi:MAG TPA: copper resistance protein CopC [Xanthobacteraceae bacterium]|nr:copper resistance protein CopC [Xanthobacteraceae bacterium]